MSNLITDYYLNAQFSLEQKRDEIILEYEREEHSEYSKTITHKWLHKKCDFLLRIIQLFMFNNLHEQEENTKTYDHETIQTHERALLWCVKFHVLYPKKPKCNHKYYNPRLLESTCYFEPIYCVLVFLPYYVPDEIVSQTLHAKYRPTKLNKFATVINIDIEKYELVGSKDNKELSNEMKNIECLRYVQNLTYYKTINPEEFKRMNKIKELHINVSINELPDCIEYLKDIEVLYIYGNNLISISDKIGTLEKLKKLTIRDTYVSKLPDTLANLKNLTKLYLDYNNFVEIPTSIFSLKELRYLDISRNRIRIIPKDIEKLDNLKDIYIYNTFITEIPEYMKNMKNLSISSIQSEIRNNKEYWRSMGYPSDYKILPKIRV